MKDLERAYNTCRKVACLYQMRAEKAKAEGNLETHALAIEKVNEEVEKVKCLENAIWMIEAIWWEEGILEKYKDVEIKNYDWLF